MTQPILAVFAQGQARIIQSIPTIRETRSSYSRSCEIPISHAPFAGFPACKLAGKDSRQSGCENGLSHQQTPVRYGAGVSWSEQTKFRINPQNQSVARKRHDIIRSLPFAAMIATANPDQSYRSSRGCGLRDGPRRARYRPAQTTGRVRRERERLSSPGPPADRCTPSVPGRRRGR